MAGKMCFPLGIWTRISTKDWSENDSIAGFFDQAVGYTVEVTYDQGTSWELAGMPQVALQSGATVRGVLVHVNAANLTPNAFSVVYERVSAGTYEPLSGALAVTLSRSGRTH